MVASIGSIAHSLHAEGATPFVDFVRIPVTPFCRRHLFTPFIVVLCMAGITEYNHIFRPFTPKTVVVVVMDLKEFPTATQLAFVTRAAQSERFNSLPMVGSQIFRIKNAVLNGLRATDFAAPVAHVRRKRINSRIIDINKHSWRRAFPIKSGVTAITPPAFEVVAPYFRLRTRRQKPIIPTIFHIPPKGHTSPDSARTSSFAR